MAKPEDAPYQQLPERESVEKEQKEPEASLEQFPTTIKFIVGQEFCERFSYYGLRAILALYLHEQLQMSENNATEAVHLFIVAAYFSPVLGAFLSDSWIGKYKTIMYLSMVYCLGNWTLSFSALHWPITAARIIAPLGLFLVALGTGGIKPCVTAFGGDQIEFSRPPSAARDQLLRMFFSAFYFAINVGATLSTIITPWARTSFHSYAMAFSLPAGLMIFATFVFWLGRKQYVHQPPSGNLLSEVLGIILEAWRTKKGAQPAPTPTVTPVQSRPSLEDMQDGSSSELEVSTAPEGSNPGPLPGRKASFMRRGSKRQVLEPGAIKASHWLDRAKAKYGEQAVEDVKQLLQVSVLLLPVPIFWSLFDQQASRWVFQAQRMNGQVLWFTIEPDQMQTANSLLILVMIPLFDRIVYPLLERRGISLRPIRRMVVGMFLAGMAFIVSGLLQIWMDSLASAPGVATSGTQWSPLASHAELASADWPGAGGPVTGLHASAHNETAVCLSRYMDMWQGAGAGAGALSRAATWTGAANCDRDGQRCISILWQFPQYVVMTAGEILFSITGLEMAYSQAPPSMTSVVSSLWCLTVAAGNLFTVLVVGSIGPLLTQAQEFFFFSAGCAVAMGLLMWIGRGFTYVESVADPHDVENGAVHTAAIAEER